jgi:hypothetical protein
LIAVAGNVLEGFSTGSPLDINPHRAFLRPMSLTASITATPATIKRLERLEATRAFDRKLILEEDGRASSSASSPGPSSARLNR